MNIANIAPAPAPLRQIDSECDQLGSEMIQFAKALDELEQRLLPVLHQSPAGELAATVPEIQLVPLAERIRTFRKQLAANTGRVSRLLDWLEL